jgi:hypothetical protein
VRLDAALSRCQVSIAMSGSPCQEVPYLSA